MRRFFTELEFLDNHKVMIQGDTAHHMIHVLRLTVEEEIEVIFCEKIYQVRICEISKKNIIGEVICCSSVEEETKVKINLYQGLPKGEKLELIIQKVTELGVHCITPVQTQRAVVKLDVEKAKKKIGRLQKIAQEASEQSKRMIAPVVNPLLQWQDFLAEIDQSKALTIVLWEDEETVGLKNILQQNPEIDEINLLIGPEGGFSGKEIDEVRAKGAQSASLGKRIFRTETAAIATVAMVLYQYDEIG